MRTTFAPFDRTRIRLSGALLAVLCVAVPARTLAADGQTSQAAQQRTASIAHAGPSAQLGGDAATAPRTAPGEEAGAYARLDPDDQKIARALMDAQTLRRDGAQCWSLDRIAAARTGSRNWAEVFHAMQTDGLLAERSLAQVTHRFDRQGSAIGIGPEMVITTAAGDQIRVATHPYRDTAHGPADGEDAATRLAEQYGEPTEDETVAPASGPQ